MIMKKKHLFIAATAIFAFASCADDGFVGDKTTLETEDAVISFDFDVPNATRASGQVAATALGNQFIVYGEKGAETNEAPEEGKLVFPNYQVNWANNTAYTTTSNTKGWEYVGYTHSPEYQSNIKTKSESAAAAVNASSAEQTIKYWDYSAANYIFTAVSAYNADITAGRVKIQKNEYGTTKYDKGYTITLAKTGAAEPYTYPTLNKLYFSDRKVIKQSAGADRETKNAYGGNVTLTFRNLVSQIRAGVYETIPGYGIKEIKFYVSDGNDAGTDPDLTTDHAFGAICQNTKADQYEGTVTVVYYTNSDGDLENQPKVTASGIPAADLILGNNFNNLSTSALLSTTSAEPTWDKSDKSFTEVLPQIENDQNLKLTVDYTLWNSVTGETIEVKGATAEIPSQYLQWKPNYKYTYLFKISDNTNGFTNPLLDPAGLWPITFDALEVEAEDNKVEFITTVSEPSITSYAKASAVITDNEYLTGNNIYAVVEDNHANPAVNINVTNKKPSANLYTVTIEDDAAQEITEETVKNALAHETETPTGTWTVTDALGKDMVVTKSNLLSVITQIPAADSPKGVNLDINGVKFTPAAPTFTAQVVTVGTTVVTGFYTRTGEGTTASPYVYTKITVADTKAADGVTYYDKTVTTAGYYAFEYITYDAGTVLAADTALDGYFTESSGTYTACTPGTKADGTITYYKQSRTYKVIKVVDKY